MMTFDEWFNKNEHQFQANNAFEEYTASCYELMETVWEAAYKEGWKTGGDPFAKPKGL